MGSIAQKIVNWSDYNKGLKQRGSLTIWLSDDVSEKWYSEPAARRSRGASRTYSDFAIETMATLQSLLSLPGRQTEGFLHSLFSLLQIELSVPEHSTLSRRLQSLDVNLQVQPRSQGCHIVIDSTGLKVFGEGEWKVKKHGKEKRRTWRKLHLCIDESTHEILSAELTKANVHDSQPVEKLMQKTVESRSYIVQASADGAYDGFPSYDCIERHSNGEATITIPPRSDAVVSYLRDNHSAPYSKQRDKNIELVDELGIQEWKKEYGYHRRSIAENAIYRYKKILGSRMSRRNFENQKAEANIKVALLNTMIRIAKPLSIPIHT